MVGDMHKLHLTTHMKVLGFFYRESGYLDYFTFLFDTVIQIFI